MHIFTANYIYSLADGVKEVFSYILDKLGIIYWMAIPSFLFWCYIVMRRYGHSTGRQDAFFKQQNILVILLKWFGNISATALLLRFIYAFEFFGKIITGFFEFADQIMQTIFQNYYYIVLGFYDVINNILPFSVTKGAGEPIATLVFLAIYEFVNNEILKTAMMERLMEIIPEPLKQLGKIILNWLKSIVPEWIKKMIYLIFCLEDSNPEVNEIDGNNYEFVENLSLKKDKKAPKKMIEILFPKFFENIYEYDPLLHRYFLKESYYWYRGLWMIVIMVLVLLGAYGKLYCVKGTVHYNLVVFPLYITTQFLFACTLDTRREFDEIRRADPDDQYGMLVKVQKAVASLEEQFSDKIKRKTAGLFELFKYPQNINWQSGEEDQNEKLIDYYIEACKREGGIVNEALAKPAKILLNEKTGIIFATRFYQDIGYSFYLPMLRVLHGGGYCLVISGNSMDDETEKALENWILKGQHDIIGDSSIWRVGKAGRDNRKYEIGVMAAEDLSNPALLHESREFLSKVRIVLLIDAGSLLYKQMFGIMNLRRMLSSQCSFAICNDNAEGLEDIYSHLLYINIHIVFPTTEPAKQTICLFFDEEDITGKDISNCLQVQVAEVFLRNGIKKVRWYGRNSVPVKDIAMRYGILNSADESDSEIEQSGRLVFGTREEICPSEEYTCIIVEDEICNPSEVSHQFASRGKSSALITVFSPQFFFLDFIRANLEQFYQNVRKIAQTFPAYYTSRRNVILQLLWVMEKQKIQDTDVCNICRALGQVQMEQELMPGGHFDKNIFAEQITYFTGLSNAGKYVFSDRNIGKDGRTYEEFWIEKLPDGIYNRKNPCYYISINPQEKHQLPQYCKEQLDQMYMQGQIITLDGNCYEVMKIVQEAYDTVMFIRKSSQNARLSTRYRQKRVITLENMEELLSYRHKMITINLMDADINVETTGYWTITIDNNETYRELNREQVNNCHRSYKKKELLCINMENTSINSRSDNAQSCMLLLSELFHTVYAKYDNQLLVCAPVLVEQDEGQQEANEFLTVSNFMIDEEWIMDCGNCFYIIEDSDEDLGLLDSIIHNFDRFLEIFNEYFEWRK